MYNKIFMTTVCFGWLSQLKIQCIPRYFISFFLHFYNYNVDLNANFNDLYYNVNDTSDILIYDNIYVCIICKNYAS